MLPLRNAGQAALVSFSSVVQSRRVREGAANLAEDFERRDRVRPRMSILQQREEGFAGMGMSDGTAKRTPQPLDPIGVGSYAGI
jgi:hypothetical protein